MMLEGEEMLLRVYLRNTDKYGWSCAADTLVEQARRQGLAGATVLRGILGLGSAGELLKSGRWSFVEHVPVLVELVDCWEAIASFLPAVDRIAPDSLVTLRHGWVRYFRARRCIVAGAAEDEEVANRSATLSATVPPEAFTNMRLAEDGQLLRVFMRATETFQGEALYRAIVRRAWEMRLAWAAVLRGVMGYGVNNTLRTSRLFGRSSELPVVVDLVGRGRDIQHLLPFVDEAVDDGTAIVEDVTLWSI